MLTVVGGILAFLFLDGWARVSVIAALLAVDLFEIAVWLRWRRRRATTGAEGLIDAVGVVIERCAPDGQIRARGRLWRAECPAGAEAGERVVVEAVDGLTLKVRSAEDRSEPEIGAEP